MKLFAYSVCTYDFFKKLIFILYYLMLWQQSIIHNKITEIIGIIV